MPWRRASLMPAASSTISNPLKSGPQLHCGVLRLRAPPTSLASPWQRPAFLRYPQRPASDCVLPAVFPVHRRRFTLHANSLQEDQAGSHSLLLGSCFVLLVHGLARLPSFSAIFLDDVSELSSLAVSTKTQVRVGRASRGTHERPRDLVQAGHFFFFCFVFFLFFPLKKNENENETKRKEKERKKHKQKRKQKQKQKQSKRKRWRMGAGAAQLSSLWQGRRDEKPTPLKAPALVRREFEEGEEKELEDALTMWARG